MIEGVFIIYFWLFWSHHGVVYSNLNHHGMKIILISNIRILKLNIYNHIIYEIL